MSIPLAAACGIVAMILTGSSVAVIGATDSLPAFGVQAARYAIAAVLVGALAAWLGRRSGRMSRPRAADLGWAALGAGAGLVGFNLVMLLGVRHAEPAVLGSAVACIPLVLALGMPLAARRAPRRRVAAGAAIVSLGAVLVTGWGRTDAIGLLCAAGLIVCEAVFTIAAARGVVRIGVFAYTAWTCGLAAGAFALLSAGAEAPDAAALAAGALPILYLGVAVTAIAFVLWFAAVGTLGAERAGLCAGAAAPASVLAAVLLGAPVPAPLVLLGTALVAAGLAIGFGGPAPLDGGRPVATRTTSRPESGCRQAPRPGIRRSRACARHHTTNPTAVNAP